MSIAEAVLELLDSAINAAAKAASDLEEVKRMLAEHPEIDDSASAEQVEEWGDDE